MILRDFMFAMLIISAVVLGFGSTWSALANNYSVQAPTQNLNVYNKINETYSLANTLQGNQSGIGNIIYNIPILGSFAAIMIAGVQVLMIMVNVVPTIFIGYISNLNDLIPGMPDWFTSILVVAVIGTIVWSVISQAIVKGRV